MEAIEEDPDYNPEDVILLNMDSFVLDTKDVHFVDVVDIKGKEVLLASLFLSLLKPSLPSPSFLSSLLPPLTLFQFTMDMVNEILDELDPRRKAAKMREMAKKKEAEKGGLFGFKFGWFGGEKK